MARLGPNRRRWCSLHQAHYLTWADAKHTQSGKCPQCMDEDARADAAAKRRAEAAQLKSEGDA